MAGKRWSQGWQAKGSKAPRRAALLHGAVLVLAMLGLGAGYTGWQGIQTSADGYQRMGGLMLLLVGCGLLVFSLVVLTRSDNRVLAFSATLLLAILLVAGLLSR